MTDSQHNQRLRPYDVLQALNRLAETWPVERRGRNYVIVPKKGKRPFRPSSAHAVLMALHRTYHWDTLAIAIPIIRGRARPAQDVDLASETHLSARTVAAVMQWLTDEVGLLQTVRDHGHTGARVRRLNRSMIHKLLGWPEPEPVMVTDSHSKTAPKPESVMAPPESVMATSFSGDKPKEPFSTEDKDVGVMAAPPAVAATSAERSIEEKGGSVAAGPATASHVMTPDDERLLREWRLFVEKLPAALWQPWRMEARLQLEDEPLRLTLWIGSPWSASIANERVDRLSGSVMKWLGKRAELAVRQIEGDVPLATGGEVLAALLPAPKLSVVKSTEAPAWMAER